MTTAAQAGAAKVWGVVAEFEGPGPLYHACEEVRDAGFSKWDAHSPFPIHGLDRAMGLRRSPLPWVVFIAGMTGVGGAMLLQWWTSAVDYPLVISGKPLFSWQAFMIICFEIGVLCAAFASVLGMLHFNRLPMWYHPLFKVERFVRASDDGFFISIEARDPRFAGEKTIEWLRDLGATAVETAEE